ncbi:Uu.00g055010.m01.CDS01 [Anthostomella pinea]|uniref:Uu.00g055010.m01.CDS01 n=1 Tax=Anthostomella pinea TaxID=933095 RepID=A0AAI8YPT2_9PEZI|nr:Uu.00g055010.m01.CDS01 [Anthostomella pinea]
MDADATPKRPYEKIIIVGAGPAGLILALLLSHHNIPSLVLEAWPGLDTRLRATQYGVPATRVFARAGILAEIREASIPSFPRITWRRVADHAELAHLDMSCIADHPDRMTIMPLGEMIKIIYRHCVEESRGLVEVRFGHRVVGVGQDGGKAWVDIEVGEVRERRKIEADYVVGCDGGTSTVRKSLFGRDWPGQTFDCQFIVQNIWYDGFEKYGWDGGNYMVDPGSWGLVAKRGKGGMWRVTMGDKPGYTEDEYLKRREAHIKRMLPGHPDPGDYRIGDTNMYKIHNRCVESMRVGRVLLAADAAHICNPMGGYGCMTAVVDVDGLADCLVGLYEGKAGEEILDTYARVRRDIFLKYVDQRSIKNLNRVAKSDPWTVRDTDPFFELVRGYEHDVEKRKAFLLKVQSIEYDFKQHYTTPKNKSRST